MKPIEELDTTEEDARLQQLAELWIQMNPREVGTYTLSLLSFLVKAEPGDEVREALKKGHPEAHSLFVRLLSSMTTAVSKAQEKQSGPPPYS